MAVVKNRQRSGAEEPAHNQQITEIAGNIAHAAVIKEGDVFFLSQPTGDVPLNNASGLGLYYHDCRYLNGYQFSINSKKPNSLLTSTFHGFMAKLEFSNPTLNEDGKTVPKQQIGISCLRVVDSKTLALHDTFAFRNFGLHTASFTVEFSFSSAFEDIFQIRGAKPEKRGKLHPPQWKDGSLQLRYDGADGIFRGLAIGFHPPCKPLKDAAGRIDIFLKAGESKTVQVALTITESQEERKEKTSAPGLSHGVRVAETCNEDLKNWVGKYTSVSSNSSLLNQTLRRSLRDLRTLRSVLHGEQFFSAGLPWYGTLFGRDSLIAAYQTLAFEPGIAAKTLRLLARYQGAKVDPFRDEQPGKILHELRHGEMANLNEIPQTPYYGSVDSTPLFLTLMAEHAQWTGSLSLFRQLKPNVQRAFEWISKYGDESGHGWLEYSAKSSRGLGNQGWKDSGDAIVHADGSLAKSPIALVEVQGLVYMAKMKVAELYELDGDQQTAKQLRDEARELRTRFNKTFWLHDKGTYALALQEGTKPCDVVSSNPGQALWTEIVDPQKAESTVRQLMSEKMFSGWGIRTLSSAERRFNPVGYHLGTVWPHDNSFIAAGFRNYGFNEEACKIFGGILNAARNFEHFRLPEVFCGFSRKEYEVPVRYPVACHPQAWASGATPFFVQSLLGIAPGGFEKKLYVIDPVMPRFFHRIKMEQLRIAGGSVDLEFRRLADGSVQTNCQKQQGVEVEVQTKQKIQAA
jgi:glycogen debranching enzyme